MKGVLRWLIQQTISPPRCSYDQNSVVSVVTDDRGVVFMRMPVTFTLSNGTNLVGSIYYYHGYSIPSSCVVYSHSLGMNQFEALNLVPFLVTPSLALVAFDYVACGCSTGDALPFDGTGAEILLEILQDLRQSHGMTRFAIWGRSLGASIALQAVSITNDFLCCVADSGFATPRAVMHNFFKRYKVPKCFMGRLDSMIEDEVLRMYGMEVDYEFPIRDLGQAQTPLLIGHGTIDTFVPQAEGRKIFDSYGCREKQLYLFEANHFKSRPAGWYEAAARFLYRKMGFGDVPRNYDIVYTQSNLHMGDVKLILREVCESNNSAELNT